MPSIETPSACLHYKSSLPQTATNSRPAVVYIHGAGGSHLDWPTKVRTFAQWPTYTLDLPGHGDSTGPGQETIEGYAQIISDFITALHLKQVVLAGHSMGGAIAMALALNQPSILRGLILIATGARMRVSPVILDNIMTDLPQAADFITKYSWAPKANFMLKGVGRRRILETEPAVLLGDYSACNQFGIRARLGEIAAPTLVIAGEKDLFMPLKFSSELAQNIPHARLVVVPESGHWVPLEKPEAVREAVESFMLGLTASTAILD